MKLTLKLLVPYIAVALFWCIWRNAWLALLAYHVQILFWSRTSWQGMRMPPRCSVAWLVLPAALAGPVVYLILPGITRSDVSVWLASYQLSGDAFLFMIPYFGLVHPVLEQLHWQPLREQTAWAHAVFAGYHLLVLATLLTVPWLTLCFVVLAGSSVAWKRLARATRGVAVPALSHILADLGIIVAAWVHTR